MANNTQQQELTNRIAIVVLNDQLANYAGIYDFGMRPSKLHGDQAEIISKGLLIGKSFDSNDTDQYATSADQATAQLIPVNYKKLYEDVYTEAELYQALMEGELPRFVALVTKRLADSIRVELEKHIDLILNDYINTKVGANAFLELTTSNPLTNPKDAVTEINALLYNLSKPNITNVKSEDGVLSFGSAWLLLDGIIKATLDSDIEATLFNPSTILDDPVRGFKILNPTAFDGGSFTDDSDGSTVIVEPATANSYGYIMANEFIFIMDVFTKFFNVFNAQNLANYIKSHYWSRVGLDESQIVIRLKY